MADSQQPAANPLVQHKHHRPKSVNSHITPERSMLSSYQIISGPTSTAPHTPSPFAPPPPAMENGEIDQNMDAQTSVDENTEYPPIEVPMSSQKLHWCNHTKATLLACDLLGVLFDRETLQTSSLTWTKSNTSARLAGVVAKKPLNEKIDYVLKKFRGDGTVTRKLIITSMKYKLNNATPRVKQQIVTAAIDL